MRDGTPVFGVWHRPNGHFIHKTGCYTVEYTTNSYGARDVERNLHSSQPRTIVLGDSFMEGMGLPDDERVSNILERDTGASTSTLQPAATSVRCNMRCCTKAWRPLSTITS